LKTKSIANWSESEMGWIGIAVFQNFLGLLKGQLPPS